MYKNRRQESVISDGEMTRMVKQKQNWERNMEKDVLEVDE
jgi:hypothetical protein